MRSSLGRVLLAIRAVRVHGVPTYTFNILAGLVQVVQTGLAQRHVLLIDSSIHPPDRDTGNRTSRGVDQDTQASVGGIIDSRAGLSTAPSPLSRLLDQPDCVHAAAMQQCHGPWAP